MKNKRKREFTKIEETTTFSFNCNKPEFCKEFFSFFFFLGILIFLLRFCVYGSLDEFLDINSLMLGGYKKIIHT